MMDNESPPPSPSNTRPAARMVGEAVKRLLNPSEEDYKTLLELLDRLGCAQMEDLAFLQETDFEGAAASPSPPLPPVLQRKLLLVAEFVRRGGQNVDQFRGNLGQLAQQVNFSRQLQLPIPPPSSSTSNTSDKIPMTKTEEEEDVIRLDVGGVKFTTSRPTLCRVPGSALEAMFSGRHEKAANRLKDGAYFIDRDGSQFHHILNCLRTGAVVSLPSDKVKQEALAVEADYYGLDVLMHALQMPKIELSDFLDDATVNIWNDEEKLRTAYRTKKTDPLALHQGLISLFSPDENIHPLPLRYDPSEENSAVPIVMDFRKNVKPKQQFSVASMDEFRSNFNQSHANVLHRLNDILREEPVIIAGGSVLKALTLASSRTASEHEKCDVDLFLHAETPSEASRIARRIFYALAVDNERWVIVRSRGVITMHNWTTGDHWVQLDQKIQIVLRLYNSPTEVLVGFDCDSCCCAYDGQQVWVTPRWLKAFRSRTNVLNPIHAWPNRPSYELRLAKYAARGYAVAVPGLDENRIDHDRIHRNALRSLKGLARLLKISFAMEKSAAVATSYPPIKNQELRHDAVAEMTDSDILVSGRESYDGEIEGVIIPRVYCSGSPWGLDWYRGAFRSQDFPLASEIKDGAWSEIANAEGTDAAVQSVPDRLDDAWDSSKRSREYLNAEGMEKMDLDNQYYDHAYKKRG